MKFTPDFVGRNDEYDDDTVRFYEKIYEDWYFYEVYMLAEGEPISIIITPDGVSVDFGEGPVDERHLVKSIHTNIVPRALFGEQKELSWDQICDVVRILEVTNIEGNERSAEEMEALYEEYKKEYGEDDDDD